MVDIATVSVVSSAAVALGTLAVNFIGGERQRKHEADLDFERRVWERKSEALFTVMQQCRRLADSDDPVTEDNRETYALNLSKLLDQLAEVRPTIEAFASTRCSNELSGLIEALTTSGVTLHVGARNSRLMRELVKLDINDNSGWSRNKEQRDEAKAQAVAGFDPELSDLQAGARGLIDAARESVRRPKD